MARILTGIQSTGTPHLGNLLGAIHPAIRMSTDPERCLPLHRRPALVHHHARSAVLRENTYAVAAAWLACGLDVNR